MNLTLEKFTSTNNVLINTLIVLLVLFIAITLVMVAIELFSDLPRLNRAY